MSDVSKIFEILFGQRYDAFLDGDKQVDVFQIDEEDGQKLIDLWNDPEGRKLLESLGIVCIDDHYEGYEG